MHFCRQFNWNRRLGSAIKLVLLDDSEFYSRQMSVSCCNPGNLKRSWRSLSCGFCLMQNLWGVLARFLGILWQWRFDSLTGADVLCDSDRRLSPFFRTSMLFFVCRLFAALASTGLRTRQLICRSFLCFRFVLGWCAVPFWFSTVSCVGSWFCAGSTGLIGGEYWFWVALIGLLIGDGTDSIWIRPTFDARLSWSVFSSVCVWSSES